MLKQHWTCFMKETPESTSRWCSVSIPSFTIHTLIAWKSILREGIVFQTHINFPRFLLIFPDFLERLSHLAPIYWPLSPETTKCSSPLTVQTLSPHVWHMFASCWPHQSHMTRSLAHVRLMTHTCALLTIMVSFYSITWLYWYTCYPHVWLMEESCSIAYRSI